MKTTLTYVFLMLLVGCSDSKYYKVQFDNIDGLTEGDKVLNKGLVVGEVKDLHIIMP